MLQTLKRAALALACSLVAFAAVAGTPTTNYSWTKPAVGADADQWGTYINSDLDGIDSTVFGIQGTANAACPKAGCTFTGGITGTTATFSGASTFGSTLGVTGLATFNGGLTVASGAATLNGTNNVAGAAGTNRGFYFQTGTTDRWLIYANGTAESGGNAGSDLSVCRYADSNSGAPIDCPLFLSRSNGSMNLSYSLNAGGNITAAGLQATANGLNVSGGFTLNSGPLTLPAGSVANADLDTVNSSSGSCGSATSTCTFTTNAQGRITAQGSAPTHAAISAATAGALETNDGTNVKWAARASAYFSSCSNFGCTMAAGNGISGATRQATGNFFVNFSTPMPNTNYTVICTAGAQGASNWNTICVDNTPNQARTTSGVDIELVTGGGGAIDNAGGFNIIVIQN